MKVKELQELLNHFPEEATVVVPMAGERCRKIHNVEEGSAVFVDPAHLTGTFLQVKAKKEARDYVVVLSLGAMKK